MHCFDAPLIFQQYRCLKAGHPIIAAVNFDALLQFPAATALADNLPVIILILHQQRPPSPALINFER